MKKLVREVPLVFFQDDGTGTWGTCHKGTHQPDDGFNAFWDGQGLFHDVFEHAHEGDRYFIGKHMLNVGGEMAAMGAMLYYTDQLGLSRERLGEGRLYRSDETALQTTLGMLQEAVHSGYCNFGYTLECAVPFQPAHRDNMRTYVLESMLDNYEFEVKRLRVSAIDAHEAQFAREYKKSVTMAKIRRLHRYGWNMAEQLAPRDDDDKNRETLAGFIDWWNKFCKRTDAEQLANWYKGGLTFRLYHEDEVLSWEAELIGGYGGESCDVRDCPW